MFSKIILSLAVSMLIFLSCSREIKQPKSPNMDDAIIYSRPEPWTRWWWFASEIDSASVFDNLKWLKDNGFGGVEIAWVYPLNRMIGDTVNYTPRQEWLSDEWTSVVDWAKHCADSLDLGCDFTFGTLWPFGDTRVPHEEAARNLIDPLWRQKITRTWEYPASGYVIDHLSHKAFGNYSQRLGKALGPAMKGNLSGLFCDSWEVETRYLSTEGFEEKFYDRYGYSITGYADSLYSTNEPYKSVRYDYTKIISELVINEFFKPFTTFSHSMGGYSRVQCMGAPCDIISAYSVVDIPESEALLYEPSYSVIVASAAGLSKRPVVTAESFTCLYGWPRDHMEHEQVADLKLLADALFANGVNHIVWHGKPFNVQGQDTAKFYASVHVGPTGALAPYIQRFNKYLTLVSSFMRQGSNYSRVAVYLPVEDSWVAGDLPVEQQFIWAWGEYEHRYTRLPEILKGYSPMWINGEFLSKASYKNGHLSAGVYEFDALYIDVKYIDAEVLETIAGLAAKGLPVYLAKDPEEPGLLKDDVKYGKILAQLGKMGNVKSTWKAMPFIPPLISGDTDFDYWCRQSGEDLFMFVAHPMAANLKFPMTFGHSLCIDTLYRDVIIQYGQKPVTVRLTFPPYQSLLLRIGKDGSITFPDIGYIPPEPVYIPRQKTGKERWEVD
jgi:hypothetical protein